MIAGIVFGIIAGVAASSPAVGVAVALGYVALAFLATPRDGT